MIWIIGSAGMMLTIFGFCNEKSCKPINRGISSEHVITYSLNGGDTMVFRTSVVFFNRYGLVDSVNSISPLAGDTTITVFTYQKSRAVLMKEYTAGTNDTAMWVATDWDEEGKVLRFVDRKDPLARIEYRNENCVGVHTARYEQDELVYTADYSWEGRRVNQVVAKFYGTLAAVNDNGTQITTYQYTAFDEKGNWTEHYMLKDGERYLQKRVLEYY